MADLQLNMSSAELDAILGGGSAMPSASPTPAPTPYQVNMTADELEQRLTPQPRSWPEFAMGALNQPLQGASFGFSDEVAGRGAAGLSSLADALMGNIQFNQIPAQYSERVDPAVEMIRQSTESVGQDYPVASTIAEIGGSATALPARVVGTTAKALGAIPKVGGVVGYGAAGAAGGALYGAGTAEGGAQERLDQAIDGAVAGAVFDAGLNTVGKVAQKAGKAFTNQADALRSNAIGLTKADRAKSVKSVREAIKFNETGRDAVDRAMDVAEKYKVLDSVDPLEIVQKNSRALSTVGDEIGKVISVADELQGKLVPTPTFKKTESWIKDKMSGTEKRKLLKMFNDEAEAIMQDLDGTVTGLFVQKQNLGNRSYSSETSSNLKKMHRMMTRELKEAVEQQVELLEKRGAVAKGTVEAFKAKNYDFENLKKFEKAFLRNAAKERGNDFVKNTLIPAMRTSGGFGVPVLAGTYMGLPALGLAAGAAGAYATTPGGKMQLSKLARSGAAEVPGNFLVDNRERMANVFNSQYQKP